MRALSDTASPPDRAHGRSRGIDRFGPPAYNRSPVAVRRMRGGVAGPTGRPRAAHRGRDPGRHAPGGHQGHRGLPAGRREGAAVGDHGADCSPAAAPRSPSPAAAPASRPRTPPGWSAGAAVRQGGRAGRRGPGRRRPGAVGRRPETSGDYFASTSPSSSTAGGTWGPASPRDWAATSTAGWGPADPSSPGIQEGAPVTPSPAGPAEPAGSPSPDGLAAAAAAASLATARVPGLPLLLAARASGRGRRHELAGGRASSRGAVRDGSAGHPVSGHGLGPGAGCADAGAPTTFWAGVARAWAWQGEPQDTLRFGCMRFDYLDRCRCRRQPYSDHRRPSRRHAGRQGRRRTPSRSSGADRQCLVERRRSRTGPR